MQHKKQAHLLIERILKWNTDRGNTPDTFNIDLEYNMLKEELDEFKEAKTDVDRLDGILDLLFVSYGTLGKMGLTPQQIVDSLEIVTKANEQKSSKKDANGKIIKNKDFVPPEPALQRILDNRISH